MKIRDEKVVEITLYEDDISFEEEISSSTLLVRGPEDYLEARKDIRDAASRAEGEPLKIRVRGERYWDWFRDLRAIGSPTVISQRDGLRRRLEKRWGSSIPAELDAEEVQELGLLDLPAPPSGTTAADYILEQKLDRVWLQEPGPSHVAKLVLSIDVSVNRHKHTEAGISRIEAKWLGKRREEIAREWCQRASEGLEPFYRLFVQHPLHACDLACTALIAHELNQGERKEVEDRHGSAAWKDFTESLSSAPHSLSDWLEIARLLSEDGDAQRCSKLKSKGLRLLNNQLLTHWKTFLYDFASERDGVGLCDLLEGLPGKSPPELDALNQYIKDSSSTFIASSEAKSKLEEKYGALENGAERVQSFVEERLIPPLPPEPKEKWMEETTLKSWKTWLESHYFPFKHSIDINKKKIDKDTVDKLEKKAVKFSEWYIDKYKELLHKGEDIITTNVANVLELIESEKKVVWVLWDNLPPYHVDKIVNTAAEENLYLAREKEWRLCLIPSITKVCIPSTTSGKTIKDIPDVHKNDRKKNIIESLPNGLDVSYMESLKGLGKEFGKDKDLYVIHFHEYDKILHKSEYNLEENRSRELARSRRRIFNRIKKASSDIPSDDGFALVVSSDHGSTLLPKHADNIPLPSKIGKEITNKDYESKRAVSLPEFNSDVEELFDPEVSTVLDPDEFSLDEPYVIARGFNSFKPLRVDDGYTHGGALPEEVLTPFLVFEVEHPDYTPLEIRVIESSLRRGEIRPLRLKIINYNETPLSPVYIRLKKGGKIIYNERIEEIIGNTSHVVDADVELDSSDKISDGLIDIEVQLSAMYLGRTENQTAHINASASERAVSSQTGEGLDDFFE